MTSFLREIGNQRDKIAQFMRKFVEKSDHVLVDLTHMLSKSEKMSFNVPGYNSAMDMDYENQINLLYIYSVDRQSPSYYRVLPGNIRDVSSFKLSMKEAGAKNAVVIIDKGFFSDDNINDLENNKMLYICPLKRNSTLIDFDFLKITDKKQYGGYFTFAGRPIWYFERTVEHRKIITYVDSYLKANEEKDYLSRIDNRIDGYSREGFFEKQYTFGTIAFVSNLIDTPEKIYTLYKGHCQIEQYFDTFKNMLHADRTYMQNEQACEAWIFINHLGMMLISKLYTILRENNLLSTYSPQDLLMHLNLVQKIKIDGIWHTAEITQKTKKLIGKLGLDIP